MNRGPHILLVEDDEVDAIAVRRALKRSGLDHTLAIATDGSDALNWLREGGHDLSPIVVTDLELPRLGGIDFINEVRADFALRDLEVIILTTRDTPSLRAEASRLGVLDYLTKPLEPAALITRLHALSLRREASEAP